MKAAALIRRIPVGMMLVPVFLGALCNTFCPGLLAIGDPFTVTFTKSGLMTIIGLMLFFTGTQMDFITIRKVAKRGLPLLCLNCFSTLYSVLLCCVICRQRAFFKSALWLG